MNSNFIRRRRLFANPIRLDFYGAFFFEFLLAADLWAISSGLADLAQFGSHAPIVTTSPWVFNLFAGIGIYGIRVAMYIAIIRKNRAPQILEWWATLVGIGIAALCMFLGGQMLRWYADLYGYERCPMSSRATDVVFVPRHTACPTGADAS